MAEAPRWWLAVGAAGNLAVVATWVVSRTVGLPLGDYAGITLPVGFPDALAAALEAVIVAGAAVLMIRGHGPVRALARSPRVAVAAAVVAAALTLAGVLAQVDAFGSSPAGSGQNGTSGVNGRTRPAPRAGAPRAAATRAEAIEQPSLRPSFRRKDGRGQSLGAAVPVVP